MEPTKPITREEFDSLLARLRFEYPGGKIYIYSDVAKGQFALLDSDNQVLAHLDYDTAVFYTLAYRVEIVRLENTAYTFVMCLSALDDTSGVDEAIFATEMMKHLSFGSESEGKKKKKR